MKKEQEIEQLQEEVHSRAMSLGEKFAAMDFEAMDIDVEAELGAILQQEIDKEYISMLSPVKVIWNDKVFEIFGGKTNRKLEDFLETHQLEVDDNDIVSVLTEELFTEMYRVMKNSAILATYSCARLGRDNMAKANLVYDNGPCVGRRGPGTIATKWI